MPKVNISKIEMLMLEKGFSLNTLSKEAELSTGTISRILNNQCNARPLTISKIAKVLEINPIKLYLKE